MKKLIVTDHLLDVNSTDVDSNEDIRLQLKEIKLIARRAAQRWSVNETGGGIVPR